MSSIPFGVWVVLLGIVALAIISKRPRRKRRTSAKSPNQLRNFWRSARSAGAKYALKKDTWRILATTTAFGMIGIAIVMVLSKVLPKEVGEKAWEYTGSEFFWPAVLFVTGGLILFILNRLTRTGTAATATKQVVVTKPAKASSGGSFFFKVLVVVAVLIVSVSVWESSGSICANAIPTQYGVNGAQQWVRACRASEDPNTPMEIGPWIGNLPTMHFTFRLKPSTLQRIRYWAQLTVGIDAPPALTIHHYVKLPPGFEAKIWYRAEKGSLLQGMLTPHNWSNLDRRGNYKKGDMLPFWTISGGMTYEFRAIINPEAVPGEEIMLDFDVTRVPGR